MMNKLILLSILVSISTSSFGSKIYESPKGPFVSSIDLELLMGAKKASSLGSIEEKEIVFSTPDLGRYNKRVLSTEINQENKVIQLEQQDPFSSEHDQMNHNPMLNQAPKQVFNSGFKKQNAMPMQQSISSFDQMKPSKFGANQQNYNSYPSEWSMPNALILNRKGAQQMPQQYPQQFNNYNQQSPMNMPFPMPWTSSSQNNYEQR